MRQAGFAYAQVRLQARLAQRPSALEWQLVENGRNLAQSLDAARQGALSRSVVRLGRDSDPAAVEEALRQAWADLVGEVAAWVPGKWRPTVLWFGSLPHLRLIQAKRGSGLGKVQALDAMAAENTDMSEAWRAGFVARLPGPDPALVRALGPVLERFLLGPPKPDADTAALSARLEKLFRSRPQEPLAVFAWLGLMALMFERLRGALQLAAIFPSAVPGRNG